MEICIVRTQSVSTVVKFLKSIEFEVHIACTDVIDAQSSK